MLLTSNLLKVCKRKVHSLKEWPMKIEFTQAWIEVLNALAWSIAKLMVVVNTIAQAGSASV
jgi:hypothetical protein